MYVQIQTTDGQLFQSDPVDWTALDPGQFDEAVSSIEDAFMNWQDANHVRLVIGGHTKFFNPQNITWAEIVY